jgi:hypothetical protein
MGADWHKGGRMNSFAGFSGNPHFDKIYAVNLNHAHEDLQDLIE